MTTPSEKPKLEAVEGGKAEKPADAEPKSTVRSQAELLATLAALNQRRRIAMQALTQLSVGRFDWHGVMDGAADLREIEAHIEAIEYALGARDTIR